jgi:hypothetical protein
MDCSTSDTAYALVSELDGLTVSEQSSLHEAISNMAVDTPQTELSVSRFKKLALKAGQTVGGSLYKMAVAIGSEATKKALVGP